MRKAVIIYSVLFLLIAVMHGSCGRLDLVAPGLLGMVKGGEDAPADTTGQGSDPEEMGLMVPLFERAGSDIEPHFSASRNAVVFVSTSAGAGEVISKNIWMINTDGSDTTQLTDNAGDENAPAWNPGSTHIAFASDSLGNQDIWILDINTRDWQQITVNESHDGMPAFNPAGTQVAFTSDRSGNLDIWTIPAAGGEPEQITSNSADDFRPHWSPDGTRIAFVSDREGSRSIWVYTIATEELEMISFANEQDDMPKWSPSGKFIAFASKQNGNWDLYIKEYGRSTDAARATLHNAVESSPTWLAGDTGLICSSNRRGDLDIWYMDFFEPLKETSQ